MEGELSRAAASRRRNARLRAVTVGSSALDGPPVRDPGRSATRTSSPKHGGSGMSHVVRTVVDIQHAVRCPPASVYAEPRARASIALSYCGMVAPDSGGLGD